MPSILPVLIYSPYLLSILCGLFIEIIFRLLKKVDESNNLGFPYQEYVPIPVRAYMSIIEYVNGNSHFSLTNYAIFRFTPPFIVLLLQSSILLKYYHVSHLFSYLLATVLVSALFRDIYVIRSPKHLNAERLVAIVNLTALIILAAVVAVLSRYINLGLIAPSPSGISDNLWSSLLASSMVALYISAINRNKNARSIDADKSRSAQISYIINSYSSLAAKYGETIEAASAKQKTSRSLLYSVLIYENMNRPKWLRRIENTTVRLTGLELSVGIAQVKSKVPVTDEESIILASKLLSNTAQPSQPIDSSMLSRDAVHKKVGEYNKGPYYMKQLKIILDALAIYETGLVD